MPLQEQSEFEELETLHAQPTKLRLPICTSDLARMINIRAGFYADCTLTGSHFGFNRDLA